MKRVVSPSKVVEQWDLEIYTLILLWRYVHRGERKKKKKNKIETGRPLFPRPRILVKISRTLRGGDPPSKTFTYDLFGGPLDHPLSLQTRRFLGFKRILRDYAPARFPYFSEPATFFFFPFPLPLPSWDRHVMPSRWFFFENKFVYVIDWTGDDNPLYNSAIFH